jgi:hypothetical protein
MLKMINSSKVFFLIVFTVIFLGISCGGSKKSSYHSRKSQSSRVSTSQLGRNKLYFSTGYQKKLKKNFKK